MPAALQVSTLQILPVVVLALALIGKLAGRSPAAWRSFPAISAGLFFLLAWMDSSVGVVGSTVAITLLLGAVLWVLRRKPLPALLSTFGALFALDLLATAFPIESAQSTSTQASLRPVVILGFSYMLFRLHDAVLCGNRTISWHRLLTQVLLFPVRTSGPIVAAGDFSARPAPFDVRSPSYSRGVLLTGLGFFKLLLLLPALQYHFETGLLLPLAPTWTALRNVLHTGFFQYAKLYLDFSAYSDIAVGLSALLGLRIRHNFHRPFSAGSLSEFWRRWHVTLSYWVRRHVYIPLGGSRSSSAATFFNLIGCMVLIGLWHGLRWNFLLWGLLHGCGLVWERFILFPLLRRTGLHERSAVRLVLWGTTQTFVAMSWLVFFWRTP